MLLVGAFAVRANSYSYFSQEINRFSKSFLVVNIKKNADFSKVLFHFCLVTQHSRFALCDETKTATRET